MMLFSVVGDSFSPAVLGSGVNNVNVTFILCGALSLAVAAGAWHAARRYGRSS